MLDALAVVAVTTVLWRGPASAEPMYQVGITAVLAVLLAPLDRLHYYVLALPAWIVTFRAPSPARGRGVWFAALTVAALLTSGMLSHIHSPLPTILAVVRQNTYNFGAVMLLIVLLARHTTLSQSPDPPPVPRPI